MFAKLHNPDYRQKIQKYYQEFSRSEQELLAEIVARFSFDVVQEQALMQAVLQQANFDPNAGHFDSSEEDEDTTGVCPHCIHPPPPPLRDYLMWREQRG